MITVTVEYTTTPQAGPAEDTARPASWMGVECICGMSPLAVLCPGCYGSPGAVDRAYRAARDKAKVLTPAHKVKGAQMVPVKPLYYRHCAQCGKGGEDQ